MTQMPLDEFDDALMRWGADPARWPGDRPAAAQALLAGSPEARAVLAEAQALEAALGGAIAVDDAPGAVAARVQAALRDRRETRPLWSLLPLKPLIGFGSLATAGGAAAGVLIPSGIDAAALLTAALAGGLL